MPEAISNITLVTDGNGKLDPVQVYDALMAQIDPELVTSEIPTLQEKYKGESSEQRKERGERYKKAYGQYESMLAQLTEGISDHTRTQRRGALASAEADSRKEEAAELEKMETLFIQ
ncbi:MAG: hypothetical protein PHU04_00540 [Candidatus Peribacteraceae bacterium]|nr:hypothetical protein [Candidatus Peribacteraceae bacterium]